MVPAPEEVGLGDQETEPKLGSLADRLSEVIQNAGGADSGNKFTFAGFILEEDGIVNPLVRDGQNKLRALGGLGLTSNFPVEQEDKQASSFLRINWGGKAGEDVVYGVMDENERQFAIKDNPRSSNEKSKNPFESIDPNPQIGLRRKSINSDVYFNNIAFLPKEGIMNGEYDTKDQVRHVLDIALKNMTGQRPEFLDLLVDGLEKAGMPKTSEVAPETTPE